MLSFLSANKQMSTDALYELRSLYKDWVPFFYEVGTPNYIDLWHDVPYYGKTDQKGILYTPKTEKLNYALGDNLITFDFVYSAFQDFRTFLRRAAAIGKTSLPAIFNNFNVHKSFVDSLQRYSDYILSQINTYNVALIQSGKTVIDPIRYIVDFIDTLGAADEIISYYSFFASEQTNILSTGLALEFFNSDHDNDAGKIEFYLSTDQFALYAQTAANFGFRVNKNAPWMLIADLNSKPMKGFRSINKSGETIDIDGYLKLNFIPLGKDEDKPDFSYLFENYHDKVINWTYVLLQAVLSYGYNDYRKRKQTASISGGVEVFPDSNFRNVMNSHVIRKPDIIVEIKEINNAQLNNTFFLTILEKILKQEFKADCDVKYRTFRKKYDLMKKHDDKLSKSLDLLEHFYSSTRIFDPNTKKPMWTIQKSLTSKNVNGNILHKNEPTISQATEKYYATNGAVAEYYIGFNDFPNI